MASRSLDDLLPAARKKCNDFLWEANRRLMKAGTGLSVLITCTYRSQREQDYLYSLGRTRPGKVVTWTKKSIHTQRRAWDVIFQWADGGITYDGPWQILGDVARQLGIQWGGAWKKCRDRPHFQVEV